MPLVDRTLAGDNRAFEELVQRHERRVYRTALSITGNPQDAEEVLQDTFLNAYWHLRGFRRDSRFTTWLTSIAINSGLHKLRGQREYVSFDNPELPEAVRMPERLESWQEDPEQLYAAEEIRRLLLEAITAMPPEYRVVLVLRDVAEMDTIETAEVLGLTITATKSRLLRARLMVREQLAKRLEKRPGWKARFGRAEWMILGMVGRLAKLPSRKGKLAVLDCRQVLAEMSNYLDDEVTRQLAHAIERHLTRCHRCWVVYNTTRKTLQIICDYLPTAAPMPMSGQLHSVIQRLYDSGD